MTKHEQRLRELGPKGYEGCVNDDDNDAIRWAIAEIDRLRAAGGERGDYHDKMMAVESQVTVALERAGFDPCPAINIAQEATRAAWGVWNKQAEEIARLKAQAYAENAGGGVR